MVFENKNMKNNDYYKNLKKNLKKLFSNGADLNIKSKNQDEVRKKRNKEQVVRNRKILNENNFKYIESQRNMVKKSTFNKGRKGQIPELKRVNEILKRDIKSNKFKLRRKKSYKKFSFLNQFKDNGKPKIIHVKSKIKQKSKIVRKQLFFRKTINSDEKSIFEINNKYHKLLVAKVSNFEFHNKSNTSQLNSKFYSSVDSKQLLVLLKNRINIYGTIKLTLIAGSVEIFGYVPNINEMVEIYSPKGCGYLTLIPRKSNQTVDLKMELKKYTESFLISEINEILNDFNPLYETILLLEKNYTKKIKIIEKYVEENLFPNMSSMRIDRTYYLSEFILRSLILKECGNKLIIDPKWNMIQLKRNSKLMIIGGKSVGKSTCLRYIINKELKNYNKILLIDLDIGQPEIFLPLTISATIVNRPLLGPGNFFNFNTTKAILYGDINVVCNPKRYLQNIKELSQYCNQSNEFSSMPWIINTMGYNKGFGSELIAVLCHFFRPTEILQLQSSNSFNNFSYLMEKEVLEKIPLNIFKKENLTLETSSGSIKYLENLNYKLVVMNSVLATNSVPFEDGEKKFNFNSKANRYLILISKLECILKTKFELFIDIKPICCCLDDVKLKLFGNKKLSEEQFFNLVDANIVYMCHFKDENSSLECLGIGIVRGIDKLHRKLYLISSVNMNFIKYVNCLSISNISIPNSMLLNQGSKIKGFVPYAYNTRECDASRPIKYFNKSS